MPLNYKLKQQLIYIYTVDIVTLNFDQTLTFNRSPFHHFVQKVNEIWYPGRAIIKPLRYQISLTSCTK